MLAAELDYVQLPVERRRLRVAVVTETFPPEINGVAMTMGRMVRALQARDHQVQLIRPRQGAADVPQPEYNLEQVLRPGVGIPRYSGLKMGLPAKSALHRLWSVQRPDVVHVATEGPLGWSALGVANKLRIPVASDFHTNFHGYSRHYGLGWLKKPIVAYLRKFHNQARVTLVPSECMRRELRAAGYQRVEVVARGVDTRLFDPARRSADLRSAWGLKEGGLAVAHVGRLAPEKNLTLLVRSFEAIERVRPDARLVLVGDGPETAALRVAHPRFVFCGPRRGEDLATHYASADMFLFPSLTETFGNVVLESMASAVPVTGFDYAAAEEHIRDGVNGMAAPYGDEGAFFGRALSLASDAGLRGRMGGEARKTALGLSWESIFARLENILLDVVRESESCHDKSIFGIEPV